MPSLPLPVLVTLVALCGVVALVAAVRRRASAEGLDGGRGPRFGNASWAALLLAVAAAALALWDSSAALLLVFALVSTVALGAFVAPGTSDAAAAPPHALGLYLCVPLQYAFVASGRYELFAVTLPLVGALALPLLALAQGEGRAFLERTAERYWIVMVCVYCVSHAPALLMLNAPNAAGLVAFLVVMTLAGQALYVLAMRLRREQTRSIRMAIGGAGGAAMMVAFGMMLAWLTPFAVPAAGAMALLIAASGALGCRVLHEMRRTHPAAVAVDRELWQSDALSFAAPVFFHAARFWLT